MKKTRTLLLILGLLIAGGAIYLIVHVAAGDYLEHKSSNGQTIAECHGRHAVHYADIQNDVIVPAYISANLCDQLVLTNRDNKVRSIAFGPHDRHIRYGGTSGGILNKGQKLTITLSQAGTYRLHDHFHDQTEVHFMVRG